MSKRDALRALSRKCPLVEQIDGIIESLEHRGDRETAIVGGAMLESCFERALIASFDDQESSLMGQLFQNRGPLSDMNSKILLAQAYGLINSSFASEMHRIRAVRNTFAHSIVDLAFTTEAIETEMNGSDLATSFFMSLATIVHEDKWTEAIVRKRFKEATSKENIFS